MRLVPLLLCLEGMAAFAQLGRPTWNASGPQLEWTLGIHRSWPTFTASAQGSKDGRASLADTDSDLGLGRAGGPYGALLEYQGWVHAFQLTYDTFRLQGERALPRDIYLNGNRYASGSVLQSRAKLTSLEGIYTYKFMRRPDAWAGLDLGVQSLKANLSATDLSAPAPAQTSAPSMTMPQIGISGGSSGVNGLLESRMFVHYLARGGANWYRYGLDGRAYLYPQFGLRAYYEASNVRIPAGSTQGGLDLRMDARTYGLGFVARF